MAALQIQKINWWHERLADWMIANPEKNLKEAAKEFDVTPQSIYIIKNSDAFQIYWGTRSGDFSKALEQATRDHRTSVSEKAAAVTNQALDALADRLDTTSDVLPIQNLIDISNMGLKHLGYGTKGQQAGGGVNVQVNMVTAEALERARARMKQVYSVEAEEPAQPQLPAPEST